MMNIVSVKDFGAVPNTAELQTKAFQKAIDFCYLNGGGEVTVPEGEYICGDIRLRSGITFHLLENAKILGSLNPKDYLNIFSDELEPLPQHEKTMCPWLPVHERTVEQGKQYLYTAGSYWNYGLIRAVNAHNISIIGEKGSELDGRNCYDVEGEEEFRGPHCIDMHYCNNLTFRGYTIRRSANWAHAIFSCNNLLFDGLTVLGGHDGIHVRKCDEVEIKNCTLKTGDDSVAGFDNCNVYVHDCVFSSACSAFRLGGQNILVEKSLFIGPCEYSFRYSLTVEEKRNNADDSPNARKNMLSMFTYFIDDSTEIRRKPKNIVFRDCVVKNADRFLHLNLSGNEPWQKGMPAEDIRFENIKAEGIGSGSICYGDSSVDFEIIFKNIEFSYRDGYENQPFIKAGNFGKLIFDNVKVKNFKGDAFIESYTTPGEVSVNKLDGVESDKLLVATDKKFVCNAI